MNEIYFIWLAEEEIFFDFKVEWESYYIEPFDARIFAN